MNLVVDGDTRQKNPFRTAHKDEAWVFSVGSGAI
jgi:hypothetical protein